jgi:hypothetical protein
MIKSNHFGSNYVNVPANNINGETYLTGQFLSDDKTCNKSNSVIYRAGTRRSAKKKKRTEFRSKVNLKKEECIMVIPFLR